MADFINSNDSNSPLISNNNNETISPLPQAVYFNQTLDSMNDSSPSSTPRWEVLSMDNGEVYYWDKLTNLTTWDKPDNLLETIDLPNLDNPNDIFKSETPYLVAESPIMMDSITSSPKDLEIETVNYEEELLWASKIGEYNQCYKMLDFGVNIDCLDVNNDTPIALSCRYGHKGITKFLIEHGANLHHFNIQGETPIMLATRGGHIDIIDLLLKHGANLKDEGIHGLDSLAIAIHQNNLSIVKHLLDQGSDINHKDKYGKSPLTKAVWTGNIELIKFLLERGSDIQDLYTPFLNEKGQIIQKSVIFRLEERRMLHVLSFLSQYQTITNQP